MYSKRNLESPQENTNIDIDPDKMIVVVCGNHDEGFEFVCYDGSEGTNPPFEIDVGLAQRRLYKNLGKL